MKTYAEIRTSQPAATGRVVVICSNGWCDWPIRYKDGTIGYEAPEKVPLFIRSAVGRLFDKIEQQ